MTKYQDYGNFLTTKHTSYACTIPERKKERGQVDDQRSWYSF